LLWDGKSKDFGLNNSKHSLNLIYSWFCHECHSDLSHLSIYKLSLLLERDCWLTHTHTYYCKIVPICARKKWVTKLGIGTIYGALRLLLFQTTYILKHFLIISTVITAPVSIYEFLGSINIKDTNLLDSKFQDIFYPNLIVHNNFSASHCLIWGTKHRLKITTAPNWNCRTSSWA
jgi:hypothetical protein